MKKSIVYILLAIIIVAGTWSLFQPGLFKVHDYTHAARIAEMARGLADGQLPVRWSANFGYGSGMPLYVFYAPLPYLIGAVPWLLGVSTEIAVKLLFFLPTVITTLAGYYLARRWLNPWGALLVAAALTLAPYRAVNLFVRGAVSEAWGMAFFIVSLLGVALVWQRKRLGWLTLVAGLCGIVLSHNLTMFMGAPFLALFVLLLLVSEWQAKKTNLKNLLNHRIKDFAILLGCVVLSIGLSAFYWLPALQLKDASQLDTYILSDYFNYNLHYLYIRQFVYDFWEYGGSSWGPTDGITFFLGWGQLLGIVLGVLMGLWLVIKNRTTKKLPSLIAVWTIFAGVLVLAGMALALTLQRSSPLWDVVSFMAYLQFPWRFMAIATSFLGLATGWWTLGATKKWPYLVAWIIAFSLLFAPSVYFKPTEILTNNDAMYGTTPASIQDQMSGILIDYIPKGYSPPKSREDFVPFQNAVRCTQECELTEELNTSWQHLVSVSSQQPATITLHQTYFPGWQAEVNGENIPIQAGDNGAITVTVPAGSHTVGFWYGRNQTLWLADALTVVSLIILVGWIAKSAHVKKS